MYNPNPNMFLITDQGNAFAAGVEFIEKSPEGDDLIKILNKGG